MLRFIVLLLLSSCLLHGRNSLQAQLLPSPGFVYSDLSLPRIDVLMDPDSLNALLNPANRFSDHEYPVDVIFTRGNRSDTLANVGFRLRGNTSRNAQKKSFRISFNSFQGGRRYEGQKNFNLIASHNDPSVSRAKLYFDLSRANGAVSSRAAHAELYINGNYRGLYINVEHINDDFVKTRFGNDDGNLYKCLYPADLAFISNNPNDYKLSAQGRRVYDLKTNEQADDYSDLAALIKTINQTPSVDIYCALDTILNIEAFLLMMAIDVTAGHWDGYYNKNNFYLYHNQRTGKFEFLPYDVDNTFNIDWFNINWATINAYQYKPTGEARPLYEKLMQNVQTRDIYSFYLKKVAQQLQQGAFYLKIDSIKTLITPAALADNFRTMDYGYNNNDFLTAFSTTQSNGHVKSGITPFLTSRASSNLAQLPSPFNIAPLVYALELGNLRTGAQGQIRVKIEDENPTGVTVTAQYTYQGSNATISLFDDGQHGDGLAGDGIYGGHLPTFAQAGAFDVQVTATDAQGNSRTRPCSPARYTVLASGPLYINEFLAGNRNGIRDEANVASDWIELYNSSNAPYPLAGHTLTDKLNNPTKWAFPNDTVPAGGYYLVWASNAVQTGPRHASFALSKSGEAVGLYKLENGVPKVLDSITFGPQTDDVSMGRLSDGAAQWVLFPTPTPLAANGFASAIKSVYSTLKAYPNPFLEAIWLENNGTTALQFQIRNALGQVVDRGTVEAGQKARIMLQAVAAGTYFLVVDGPQGRWTETFLKK